MIDECSSANLIEREECNVWTNIDSVGVGAGAGVAGGQWSSDTTLQHCT
jgi:hypothetical protein